MKMLFFVLLFPVVALAQKDPIDTVSFNYSGVNIVDSASAKTLQARARVFVTENFKSAKDVIQLDDQDAGVMIVKGNIVPIVKSALAGTQEAGYVNFMVKLQFKDGKYKYTLSDFNHEGNRNNIKDGGSLANIKPACGTWYMYEGYWRKIKIYVDNDARNFVANLTSAMKNSEIGTKKDSF
jgi:hypothetical protein